jgi:hypothetical protein
MTDKKPSKNPLFVNLCTRLNLDESRAAAYLGVPVFTFRKWLSGERTPNASALRLIEVLGVIETLAPALHASFMPEALEKVKRGRPVKKVHVEEVPSNS